MKAVNTIDFSQNTYSDTGKAVIEKLREDYVKMLDQAISKEVNNERRAKIIEGRDALNKFKPHDLYNKGRNGYSEEKYSKTYRNKK